MFTARGFVKFGAKFGTTFAGGYAFHWAVRRDETPAQLASWLGVRAIANVASVRVWLGKEEAPAFLQGVLSDCEESGLRRLISVTEQCRDQDLESVLLRSVVLQTLCQHAESAVESPAARGVHDPDQKNHMVSLAALLDESATALGDNASAGAKVEQQKVLLPVAEALNVMITSLGANWAQELGSVGVLHFTRTAVIASSWCKELPNAVEPLPVMPEADDAEDDKAAAINLLSTVWQSLGSAEAVRALRPRGGHKSSDCKELLKNIDARFKLLENPPPTYAPAPEVVPPKLRSCISVAMGAKVAQGSDSQRQGGGWISVCKKALLKTVEFTGCVLLVGGIAIAVSKDGFGFLQFHAVPEKWRGEFQDFITHHVTRVEELSTKPSDSPVKTVSESISLGPKQPWETRSNYLEPAPTTSSPKTIIPSGGAGPTFKGS